MSTSISRADFLKALAGLSVLGIGAESLQLFGTRQFTNRMLGPSRRIGHLLREPQALAKLNGSQAVAGKSAPVVIVGAGMAGLSAGWWLKKQGCNDFLILELESQVGGNSASGQNQYGAYPWGAHYIPIPNSESSYVRELFEEFNIIKGYEGGQPVYDELMLCHEPQDRLYKDGAWHEGLIPKRGLQPIDTCDIARFFSTVAEFRGAHGSDGKPAFAIPLDLSSVDEKYRSLDKLSMRDWLAKSNFKSEQLLWYINYCCRDDYGASLENVSAWAGLHYFAGRRGTAANAEQNAVLTWPQGNGYISERLRERLAGHIQVNKLVTQVRDLGSKLCLNVYDEKQILSQIESKHVIFAAPRFIARKICHGMDEDSPPPTLNYAPWLVANISLKRLPEARGVAPAWDNVSYYSPSLGYVMANHQDITTRQKPLVITYYFPLSDDTPKQSRMKLFTTDSASWSQSIVKDLSAMHPGIESEIISIDIWPWGHGMVSPSVGFIWGERSKLKQEMGRVVFAHSDMSGISNFEEAQYHGVEAAKRVLAKLSEKVSG